MSSVDHMMAKAVTTSPEFYGSRNVVKGYADKKDDIRKERKDKKETLSQWYGMKKVKMTPEQKRELELLQYRNFIDPNAKHQAPKKTSTETDFVEFGYFAGTGKNKRKRYRSFADEWIEENPEFQEVVTRRVKTNVKLNRKTKEIVAKKEARKAEREKMKKESKRKPKHPL
ncbi:hypothetical protein AGDE_06397 [Angomonas deanei]|nr:hypothetical protein AGDE_06397 [Angomonas deanei]|eukprot:EPY37537.1 hypothetical protein AGDE_06397 [Angomonas deanei]